MNEIESDAQANHARFISEVRASGLVWGLQSDHGWAVCESEEYEDTDVYPFWSDEAGARVHASGDWSEYRTASLDLDLFIDTWLAGMSEDGVLVGTNWDADLSGLEVEPVDLAQALLAEGLQAEHDDD
jgi:hypothetical protein